MGPIEITWGIVVVFFAIVGLVRGYARELGATLVILVAMFVLTQFGEVGLRFLAPRVADVVGMKDTPASTNLLSMILAMVFFLIIVFAAYQGDTLTFEGKPARGAEGALLSLGVGLINGYLVSGTLWFYMDRYQYPIGAFFSPPLTPFAKTIIPYLPPHVLSVGALTALIALMVLLRVRR